VVGSDVPGVRDAIDDGRTGILVQGGDPAALADALQRLADDVGLRAQLGAHAREQVEAEHSARRMADGYLRLLGELDPEGPWSSVDAARTE
jgi:glycosyltransferase involved in cell wall biosynthesis